MLEYLPPLYWNVATVCWVLFTFYYYMERTYVMWVVMSVTEVLASFLIWLVVFRGIGSPRHAHPE
jgi:hypothetical protein